MDFTYSCYLKQTQKSNLQTLSCNNSSWNYIRESRHWGQGAQFVPDMSGEGTSLMRPIRVAMILGVLIMIFNRQGEARTFSK